MEAKILEELAAIKAYTLLAAKKVFCLDEAAIYLGMQRSYLYKLTSACKIPHYKPNGKCLYFERAELDAWMQQNRVNTQTEAEQAALCYTMEKGGGK